MNEILVLLKKRLTPYACPALVALGWGTCVGGITLWTVFQGLLLPNTGSPTGQCLVEVCRDMLRVNEILATYYIGIFSVSVVSGLIIEDYAKTFGGFLVAYSLGAFIIFETLAAPGLSTSTLNSLLLITRNALTSAAIDLTFRIMFPLPIFVMIVGSILGTALKEHYF